MAKFSVTGFDDIMSQLNSLEREEIAPKMLKAGKPILERNVKAAASSHRRTGSMAGSVKSTGVKENASGHYLVVRPTGRDGKGVRNMEKMAYLEFGTSKQTATPVLTPAVQSSEGPVLEAMQKVFDEETEGMQL